MTRLPRIAVLLLVVSTLAGPSQAASIMVLTDSGNIGDFTFTNTGTIGGTAAITVSVPSLTSTMDTVNGAIVTPEPVVTNTPLTLLVTPTGVGTYALSLPSGDVKTVGSTVGAQAKLGFNLASGNVPATLPDFFNATGPVLTVLANANPTYNFVDFANGLGTINLTFTATSFTGATNFATFFATPGATAVGNGSFSQVATAVPEPASAVLALMGSLCLGVCAVVRRR